MAVGVIILSNKGTQDIRYLKGFIRSTLISCLINNLNLIGFSYTLVYYSKELIIDYLLLSLLMYIKYLILLGSICTITYSLKLVLVLI